MSHIKNQLIILYQSINRKLFSTNWKDLRSTKPVSNIFGADRGTPVDRFYIENFLSDYSGDIKGTVVEIGESYYTDKFGTKVEKKEVLHFTNDNPQATLIGDLTKTETLKAGIADCFICTQTLNFIYDIKNAIRGICYLLKPGGVGLITVSGISQISRYDMDRWGDYWRFTSKSAEFLFSEVFGEENIKIHTYGNVLSSIAFLEGISAEELTRKELDCVDPNYQIIIAIRIVKS